MGWNAHLGQRLGHGVGAVERQIETGDALTNCVIAVTGFGMADNADIAAGLLIKAGDLGERAALCLGEIG